MRNVELGPSVMASGYPQLWRDVNSGERSPSAHTIVCATRARARHELSKRSDEFFFAAIHRDRLRWTTLRGENDLVVVGRGRIKHDSYAFIVKVKHTRRPKDAVT